MTADSPADAAARPDGAVTGTPRRWLRLEGAVLLAGSLIAYPVTRQAYWLVPLTILLPDLLMIGYLGYGLKYSDHFQHTHLGHLGHAPHQRREQNA